MCSNANVFKRQNYFKHLINVFKRQENYQLLILLIFFFKKINIRNILNIAEKSFWEVTIFQIIVVFPAWCEKKKQIWYKKLI